MIIMGLLPLLLATGNAVPPPRYGGLASVSPRAIPADPARLL